MSASLANPIPLGDNPQQPYAYAETYIPDQLIAGNLKLVTDHVLIGGNTPLPRGSVLGLQSTGTTTSSAGKTFATGSVTVAALPVANDTLTIAGTVITFVTANPTGNQVMIGGPGPDGNPPVVPTVAGTALALIEFLNASSDPNLVKMSYVLNGNAITMTSVAIGTSGNALTLATSDATAFTLSGGTLTGGTANAGAETIGSIFPGPRIKTGNYVINLSSVAAYTVTDPSGAALPAGVVGSPYVDPQIGFTVTTGTGIAIGDQFIITAGSPTNYYILATANATDGSQNPIAVLADYAAPATGTPVTSGVYLMGEFNQNVMYFGEGITPASAKASLRPFGIFLKDVVTATDPS